MLTRFFFKKEVLPTYPWIYIIGYLNKGAVLVLFHQWILPAKLFLISNIKVIPMLKGPWKADSNLATNHCTWARQQLQPVMPPRIHSCLHLIWGNDLVLGKVRIRYLYLCYCMLGEIAFIYLFCTFVSCLASKKFRAAYMVPPYF